jgi:hypothetical protein
VFTILENKCKMYCYVRNQMSPAAFSKSDFVLITISLNKETVKCKNANTWMVVFGATLYATNCLQGKNGWFSTSCNLASVS